MLKRVVDRGTDMLVGMIIHLSHDGENGMVFALPAFILPRLRAISTAFIEACDGLVGCLN